MKTLVRTLFGSHLYGTNTETSDTDRKAVHLPDPIAMLLHERQDVLNNDTKVGNVGKNLPTDVTSRSPCTSSSPCWPTPTRWPSR
jgi:hypothetical protein